MLVQASAVPRKLAHMTAELSQLWELDLLRTVQLISSSSSKPAFSLKTDALDVKKGICCKMTINTQQELCQCACMINDGGRSVESERPGSVCMVSFHTPRHWLPGND